MEHGIINFIGTAVGARPVGEVTVTVTRAAEIGGIQHISTQSFQEVVLLIPVADVDVQVSDTSLHLVNRFVRVVGGVDCLRLFRQEAFIVTRRRHAKHGSCGSYEYVFFCFHL